MMYRSLPFLLLFALTVLLQLFLFDNLSISVYFNPLIYIAFILLLPLDTPRIVLLGAGVAMGVVMDYAMGAAGVNVISTTLIAFLRPWIIRALYGHDDVREGGIPSPDRFGKQVFFNYLVFMVLVHHLVFFSLESLSWVHIFHTLLRVVASSSVSILFIWIIARLFTSKFPVRI